ncbi:porin [Roseateles asaccharophilus]|uniref:Porin n=1 Tax=Roseateles asaccharophilus TaxID=582607 RepID=A0ABU2A1J0_9BURK|nr:porin [Roseateles asaccharophilus]MDR7331050.1 putative porin [Roseateles asaccharophilus]
MIKKATLAVAVLAASTSAAWAQSSVTLYGIVDAAVRYTSNASAGTSTKQLIPGGMSQSRLGVNITEDMGGGLKALANMEHRLNSDTGTVAAADFWRQAWVGIQSSEFGQIRLGRQYNIMFDIYTSTYASFRYSPYIEAYKPEIGLSLGARQDNMVKYLAEFGPVRGEIQVSAGEGNSQNKSIGGMLRYAQGEWAFGGAYLQVTDTLGKKVKGTTIGGSYTSGPWYVNLSWAQNKFDAGGLLGAAYTSGLLGNVLNAAANDVKKRDMISVGATYQLTPQLNFGAHYWRADQTHYTPALANVKSKGDYFAGVLDYAFSKRTDAYLEVDYTKFNGAVRFSNTAAKRGGAMVGLRHRF